MHTLIVVAHPEDSLTRSLAAEIGRGIGEAGPDATFELVDLAGEGFHPRFTRGRHRAPLGRSGPADVVAEQRRVDGADTHVLVYPVYWWSMPALLKGWVASAFTNGWAFGETTDRRIGKRLGRLQVRLLAVAGADARVYGKQGYFGAMKFQLDHGAFDSAARAARQQSCSQNRYRLSSPLTWCLPGHSEVASEQPRKPSRPRIAGRGLSAAELDDDLKPVRLSSSRTR